MTVQLYGIFTLSMPKLSDLSGQEMPLDTINMASNSDQFRPITNDCDPLRNALDESTATL